MMNYKYIKAKKNIKYFILIGALVVVFLLNNYVYAEEIQGTIITEYTNQYKIWEALSKEEKHKYIEPIAYPIQFDPTYLKSRSTINTRARTSLPSKYNLNDEINIAVKNQGKTNACWAFAMTSALESNIALKTGTNSPLYSVRHMEYATSKTFLDRINEKGFTREVGAGGNPFVALAYATNGTGLVKETKMPFEDNENKIDLSEINKVADLKINNAKIFTSLYKYKDAESNKTVVYNGLDTMYTEEQVTAVRNHIKQYIMENGALAAFTYANASEYYNNSDIFKATAYYCDSKTAIPDHAVTIVGWDDNYDVTNFNEEHRPQKPGAYIVLNSYGEEVMDKGYYYISYEDALIESSVVGVSKTESINYDNIYQNDFYGYTNQYSLDNVSTIYGANVFKRNTKQAEQLEEVVICVPITTDIEVYVNPNGDELEIEKLVKASIETPKISETYNTVKLTNPIELTGEKFAIVVKYNVTEGKAAVGLELNYKTILGKSTMFDCITSNEGESFLSLEGDVWADVNTLLEDTNICIKGITTLRNSSGNIINNNTNNSNNGNSNNNGSYSNNGSSNIKTNNKDNSTAPYKLPNAGNIRLIFIVLILGASLLISAYKCKKYKKI